jgi:hypothetical protein
LKHNVSKFNILGWTIVLVETKYKSVLGQNQTSATLNYGSWMYTITVTETIIVLVSYLVLFSLLVALHVRENFWDISSEKSWFYAKIFYFFQLRREARKILGYFVWKIMIILQKIIFFPILEGGRVPGVSPLDPPLHTGTLSNIYKH